MIRNIVFDMGMVLLDHDPLLPHRRSATASSGIRNGLACLTAAKWTNSPTFRLHKAALRTRR